MEYSQHQKICIAQVLRIARLRGFAVDESDAKYQKMGLTWSAELAAIPVDQIRAAVEDAWSWSDKSGPLTTDQILAAWKGSQRQAAPESFQVIARMANCAHDYRWYPEPGPLFNGFWACLLCGHARPVWKDQAQTAGAAYLRAAGVTTT